MDLHSRQVYLTKCDHYLMFIIEDECHAELQPGEFPTLAAALSELKRRGEVPWNEPPNLAPYMSWQTCGRTYVIVELDASVSPWRELRRLPYLEVSSGGVRWLSSPDPISE